MKFSEEHVTRKLAITLQNQQCEIIAVHPPDGQGPFVIPKPPQLRDIERSSYHPDLVGIRIRNDRSLVLVIAECKLDEVELKDDYEKLKILSESRDSLLYAFFRCQLFQDGPTRGFDFEEISKLETSELPIEFYLASQGKSTLQTELKSLNGFPCYKYTWTLPDLIAL
jgi:hypothetical protein